jgi:hypothetical protein
MSKLLKYKITPIWKIEVKDGKTRMPEDEFSRYKKWLLSHQGGYEFTIKKKFKKRSLPQNSWYWGVIVPMIAEEIGEDDLNEVHAYLKAKFLSKEKAVAGKDGQWDKTIVVGRTAKLDTHSFGLFVEKVRRWASSFLGLNIPDPNPEYNSQAVLIDDD